MKTRHSIAVAALALSVVACSSSSTSSTSSKSSTSPTSSTSSTSGSSPTSAASSSSPVATGTPGSFAASHYSTKLDSVCPNPVVIQTDWVPEADHAFLYQMIGGGGTQAQYTYTGPLGSTGINLQILAGGPGLGNGVSQPSSLYLGNLVKRVTPTLAFVSSDDAIQYSKQFATTAVFAEYQKSPQVIMFDPAKYHITSLADLKTAVSGGAKMYVESTTFSFVRWLESQGIPSSAFIGGYAGDLEKFVGSGGSLLNQGFATNEVYTLGHNTPNWDKTVGYAYIADLGLPFYQSSVSVANNKLSQLKPCQQKLVPIMQQAQVDYVTNPSEINTLLADYNNKGLGASFWKTPVDLNDAAAKIMVSDKLVANTPGTSSLGGFNMSQVDQVLTALVPVYQAAGTSSLNPAVKSSDIATNQFIDTTIGLK